MTTVIRKKQRSIDQLDEAEKYAILKSYKESISISNIAKEYNIPYKSIETFINKEYQEFLVSKESHSLYNKNLFDNLRRPKDINDEFMEAIEDGAALTYAWYYAKTNDNHLALKESGLLVGILKQRNKDTKVTRNAERLRGLYLRTIPEVNEEIRKIREEQLLNSPVSREYVQSELITQLEELKEIVSEEPRQRGNLLKTVEMLGRSIGAFSDKIQVEDVSPDKALDMLIEMSKAQVSSTYEEIDE